MKRKTFVFAALVMALMVSGISYADFWSNVKKNLPGGKKTETTNNRASMDLSTARADSIVAARKAVAKADSVKKAELAKKAVLPARQKPITAKPAYKRPAAKRPISEVWVNANEKIISGFKPELKGMTSVQITALKAELAEFVQGKNPSELMVEVVGLTDTLSWQNLPKIQWMDADTAMGEKRATTVQRIFQDEMGWEARPMGVKTNTPYRGVLVRLVKYQEPEKVKKDTIREKSLPVEKIITKTDTSLRGELRDGFKKINSRFDSLEKGIGNRVSMVETKIVAVEKRVETLEKGKPKSVSETSWNLGLGYSYWSSQKRSLRTPMLGLIFSKPDWVFQTQVGYLPNQVMISEMVSLVLGRINPVLGSMFGWRLNANDQWTEKTVSGILGVKANQNIGPFCLDLTVGATYGKVWTLSNQQWKPGLLVSLKGGLR